MQSSVFICAGLTQGSWNTPARLFAFSNLGQAVYTSLWNKQTYCLASPHYGAVFTPLSSKVYMRIKLWALFETCRNMFAVSIALRLHYAKRNSAKQCAVHRSHRGLTYLLSGYDGLSTIVQIHSCSWKATNKLSTITFELYSVFRNTFRVNLKYSLIKIKLIYWMLKQIYKDVWLVVRTLQLWAPRVTFDR